MFEWEGERKKERIELKLGNYDRSMFGIGLIKSKTWYSFMQCAFFSYFI